VELFAYGESDQQHPPPIIDNQFEAGSDVQLEPLLTCAGEEAFQKYPKKAGKARQDNSRSEGEVDTIPRAIPWEGKARRECTHEGR
jgi:hypothetical protein